MARSAENSFSFTDRAKLDSPGMAVLAMLKAGGSAFITEDQATETIVVSVTLPLELTLLPELATLKSQLEFLSQHEGKFALVFIELQL